MLRVGITGGIGTGKTTVAKIFSILGIPVYEADKEAKILVETNETIREGVIRLIGKEAYFENGEYNKKLVAGKVFNDQSLLKKLNQVIHPVVINDYKEWVKNQDQNLPYIIKEAAIMDKIHSGVDKIIVVTSPIELRVKRISKRDQRNRTEIENIIKNQRSEEGYLSLADFEIRNNESEFLVPQVMDIDQQLRTLAVDNNKQ